MIREGLKSIYYILQKVLGKDRRLLQKIRDEDLVTVLNFHQVSPCDNPFWPPLKPYLFDDLLSFLKENFEIVLFRDIKHVKSEKPPVVLSFDDGYKNFLEYAVPILDKYDLSANMNIIPQCAESGRPIWNVRLYDFLNSAPKQLIDEIRFPGFEERLRDETYDSKLKYGLKISRFLKNRSKKDRDELLNVLDEIMLKCDFKMTEMMNVDEIKQIAENHEIGVHSYSHESMEYENDDFFEADLKKCHEFFEERLNVPLNIYAFPNGSHRVEQIEILKQNNIAFILLVGEDHTKKETAIFKRFTIYGESRWENRFQSLGLKRSI